MKWGNAIKENKSTPGAWFIKVECSQFRPYKVFHTHRESCKKKKKCIFKNECGNAYTVMHTQTFTNDLIITPFKMMLFIELTTVLI